MNCHDGRTLLLEFVGKKLLRKASRATLSLKTQSSVVTGYAGSICTRMSEKVGACPRLL